MQPAGWGGRGFLAVAALLVVAACGPDLKPLPYDRTLTNFDHVDSPRRSLDVEPGILAKHGPHFESLSFNDREFLFHLAREEGREAYHQARGTGTPKAFETYINRSAALPAFMRKAREPYVVFAKERLLKLRLAEDYAAAAKAGTRGAYEKFLATYADNPTVQSQRIFGMREISEAETRLSEIIYAAAEAEGTIAAWETAVDDMPFGEIRQQAFDKVKDMKAAAEEKKQAEAAAKSNDGLSELERQIKEATQGSATPAAAPPAKVAQ